jgi:hypothetical protein
MLLRPMKGSQRVALTQGATGARTEHEPCGPGHQGCRARERQDRFALVRLELDALAVTVDLVREPDRRRVRRSRSSAGP